MVFARREEGNTHAEGPTSTAAESLQTAHSVAAPSSADPGLSGLAVATALRAGHREYAVIALFICDKSATAESSRTLGTGLRPPSNLNRREDDHW